MTTPCPHCNDTRTITLLYSQVPCECAAPWWSLQDGSDMVPSTPTPHTRPPSVHSAEWYRALNRASVLCSWATIAHLWERRKELT